MTPLSCPREISQILPAAARRCRERLQDEVARQRAGQAQRVRKNNEGLTIRPKEGSVYVTVMEDQENP